MTPWLAAVAAFIGLILVVTLIVVLLGPIARRLAKRDHKSQSEVHVEALNATRDTLVEGHQWVRIVPWCSWHSRYALLHGQNHRDRPAAGGVAIHQGWRDIAAGQRQHPKAP